MSIVNFEGLGLSFNINNVALDFGTVKIYWYAIFIIIGVVLAILLCKHDDGKYNIKFENILELALFLLPVSILCARIYFVIFNLDYYLQDLSKVFYISDGGLAIYGGIIGGILTIYVYSRIKNIDFTNMCDYIVIFLPLAQAIGRWGNFFNLEAHGTETMSILRMGIIENGKYIEVHPTFLYESFFNLIIFIVLFVIRNKRKFKGQITCIYFILYGLIRAFIEGLRTDSLMLGSIRVSQMLSIFLVIVFTIILIINIFKENKNNN